MCIQERKRKDKQDDRLFEWRRMAWNKGLVPGEALSKAGSKHDGSGTSSLILARASLMKSDLAVVVDQISEWIKIRSLFFVHKTLLRSLKASPREVTRSKKMLAFDRRSQMTLGAQLASVLRIPSGYFNVRHVGKKDTQQVFLLLGLILEARYYAKLNGLHMGDRKTLTNALLKSRTIGCSLKRTCWQLAFSSIDVMFTFKILQTTFFFPSMWCRKIQTTIC